MFIEGRDYTRDEIHAQVGGSTETYLPNRDGRILCACLDRDLNPDAPHIIIPGSGPMIEKAADLLRRQAGAIPVFIKQRTGAWRYVGDFEVEPHNYTAADIEAQKRRSGRPDITRVIWLRPAVPLHAVRTVAEALESARRFPHQVRGSTALRRIFRTTRCWLATDDGAFAPVTWAAYGDVSIDIYVAAMRGEYKSFPFSEADATAILASLGFLFIPDGESASRLVAWASSLEQGFLDGLDVESLTFGTADAPDRPVVEPDSDDAGEPGGRVFALIANASMYDVGAASRALSVETWMFPEGDARVGDRIAFWRTLGADRERGIVAFGVVTAEPSQIAEDPESAPFWLGTPSVGVQRRIRLRYVRTPNLPLWLDDDTTGTLASLTVSRGQGNKPYKITLEQWAALVRLAGGWPAGQGSPTTASGAAPTSAAAPIAPAPAPVRLVLTPAEVAASIATFNRDAAAADADRVRNMLRTTSLWVYDGDADAFGPNKFVGWHPTSFALYGQGLDEGRLGGVNFDGHVTRRAIEAAVGRGYVDRPAAHAALVRWAEGIGGAGVLDVPTPQRWEFLALDQWPDEVEEQRVAVEVREAAEEIVERRRGQGYSSDPAMRRAVELHAMGVGKAYLVGLGWDPKDTSATRPYDFECEGAPDHRYVEVKGTTGDGSEVLLTVNEVEHARAHPGVSALFVVHRIQVAALPDGMITASGGTLRVISPWSPNDGDLRPLTFKYTLPSS